MNPQKSTMSVLAQIASWIPDRIIDNLAKKHKIQTRAFSANSPSYPKTHRRGSHLVEQVINATKHEFTLATVVCKWQQLRKINFWGQVNLSKLNIGTIVYLYCNLKLKSEK